jgi:hypothetical protein
MIGGSSFGIRVKANPASRKIDLDAGPSLCKFLLGETGEQMDESEAQKGQPLYCPVCGGDVPDPPVCGDCGAVICRKCGTPLEKVDELGIG